MSFCNHEVFASLLSACNLHVVLGDWQGSKCKCECFAAFLLRTKSLTNLHRYRLYNCLHLTSVLLSRYVSSDTLVAWLAQLVERQSAVREVEGSSPRPDQLSGS